MAFELFSLIGRVSMQGADIVNKQLSGVEGQVARVGQVMGNVGMNMTKFVTLPLLAVGAILGKIGLDFENAYNTIRAGTGATGEALDGLKEDFKAVLKDVPADFKSASQAIADLNTRLGLTGKPLQNLTKQMLNLARITKTDVNAVVRTSTRLFGDWDIATEDYGDTLDTLFKISQSTGIGIDRLSDMVTTYGVQLRTCGFDLETSLALMGKWEKEGVSAEKMLGGLSMALGRFAKAQKEPEEALRNLMAQIEAAPTVGKAMEFAVEALGTRAGPDFALAVREGRFAVEDFMKAIDASTETIDQAADATLSFTDRLKLLKNKALVALEPLGTAFIGVLEGLLPSFDKVINKIKSAVDWFSKLSPSAQKIIIIFTGILALAGPLMVGISKVTASVLSLKAAVLGLNTAMLLNPYILIGAAIIQLGIQAYTYTDAITKAKKGTQGWGEALFNLIPVFGPAIYALRRATEGTGELTEATEEEIPTIDKAKQAVDDYKKSLIDQGTTEKEATK